MSPEVGSGASGVAFAVESARLEAAYWRLLRFYPRRWRQRRGAELVSVLMDVALARGRTRPSRRDRVELAVFGGLARWESLLAGAPVRLRDYVADLAAVLLFAVTVSSAAFGEVAAWRAVDIRPNEWVGMGPSTAQLPLALLLAAFACRVLAFRVTAQVLYLVVAVLMPAVVVAGRLLHLDHPPATFMLVLAGAAAVSAVSAPMHRTRERLRLGLAGVVGAAALLAFLHLSTVDMHLNPVVVSYAFYYFHGRLFMVTALLWVTLPVFAASLGMAAVRRDPRPALMVGVACLPWWAFYIASALAQMRAAPAINPHMGLALAATVVAVAVTSLLARAGVARRSADRFQPLS